MSLKKRLQALCKIAKAGKSFDVKFTEDGMVHATDNAVMVSTRASHVPVEPCVADPESLSLQVKQMTKDSIFHNLRMGHFPETNERDFSLAVPDKNGPSVHVDPFVMKSLFDALTQCWEGPKAEAAVLMTYVPETSVVVLEGPDGLRAVLKPVVKL